MSSGLVNPLLLPEIISTLASFLGRQDLIRCLSVCSLWLCFLEPELYRVFHLPTKVFFLNRTKRRRRRAALRKEQERLGAAHSLTALHNGEYRYRRIPGETLRRNGGHIRSLRCFSLSMIEYLAPLCTRLEKVSFSQLFNLKTSLLLSMNATSLRAIDLTGHPYSSTGAGRLSDEIKEYQTSLWTMFKVMAEQLFGLEELKLNLLRLCGQTPVGKYALIVFTRIRVLDLCSQSLSSGWPWQSDFSTAWDTEGRPRAKLMPNMRSLSLIMSAEPISGLVLSECSNLTSFAWSGYGINTAHTNAQMETMLELLKEIKTLLRIELTFSPTVSDKDWCQIIEALPRLRALDAISTGFGPLACGAVVQREKEHRGNMVTNEKSTYGTRPSDEPSAFEELGLQCCQDVTSREMSLLLRSCNHLKILRGTTLEERAVTKDVIRSLDNPEVWLWPSSRTLQHLELSIEPTPISSDRSERLEETSQTRERMTPSLTGSPEGISDPKIEPNLLRHQFMFLSSLESLKANYWTLAQVYQTSADDTKNDSTTQKPNPRLRSIQVQNWTGTPQSRFALRRAPRHRFVTEDPSIKDWLPKAVPSLRKITRFEKNNSLIWEWKPPSFHDGLPFNSRPFV